METATPTGEDHGLTQAEAERRLREVGPNAPPQTKGRGLPRILLETLREPMFLLLLAAAGLYLVLGDLKEGVFLSLGALGAVGLVIAQEARSERALAALRDLSQPMARVIRDGVAQRISARELVPGDLVMVGEGERIPADGLLVSRDVLGVDESILTGESALVDKRRAGPGETPDPDRPPGPEPGPWLYAGTLNLRGQGLARVTRTGAATALGQIGASLATLSEEPTPLQQTSGRLVGWLGVLALGFCLLVTGAYGLVRGNWIEGGLAGLTVAIALVPEEFPMVLAVFLALGAQRLARHRVLVRRNAAIEALGGATVLCVDKTGTLTENRMQVARLWPEAGAERVAAAGRLASAPRPSDPMDRALLEAAGPPVWTTRAAEPHQVWPLTPERMAVIQAWATPDGDLLAAKGAPEAIAHLCRLSASETQALMTEVRAMAEAGLRVLGVCARPLDGTAAPEDQAFQLTGLVGFEDPLRPDVGPAIAEARAAGVQVMMITGDHPATALAIARAAGLNVEGGVLLGAELARLEGDALAERLDRVRVFARVTPEQKLALVEALKARGEVVVMTGDGVNDAPALEAAHIGVAMGRRGSDVAREAADLVLLDDSFSALVGGVRLGRRIFANLRRALTYVTAIHVPVAGLALAPVLLGLPPLLYPMHVMLLELAIDPICALVFEGEPSEARAMRRPPRRRDEPLFGPSQLARAVGQGLVVLGAVLGVYLVALGQTSEPQARGAAFLALAAANLVLALADAASGGGRVFGRHRRVFWMISGALTVILAAVLLLPGPAQLFRMAPPPPLFLVLALAAAAVGGGWPLLARRAR